jgi:hypothetical protein
MSDTHILFSVAVFAVVACSDPSFALSSERVGCGN